MSLPYLLPATSAFIQRAPRMLIGSDWVEASDGQTMPLHNPATGEVLCVVPRATPEDVDRAVLAARQAFDDSAWSRTRPRERQNLLWKLADLMQRDAELLAQLECLNNGKSAAVAQVMDVQLAIDFLRYMAGWATKIEGSSVEVSLPLMPGDQFHSFIRREAVGVVGAIVAWNFPLLLACWKLGPALATGCTVVLKPADETPLTALKLAELVLEAGYPEGVFNVVTGTGITAGSALTHNPLVDKLTFTGSTAVGKQLAALAGQHMKRVSMELGGHAPVIVASDANVALAARFMAPTKFHNAGQACVSPTRFLVHNSLRQAFEGAMVAYAKSLKPGDGLADGTTLGPLANARRVTAMERVVEDAVRCGATLAAGGRRLDMQGNFFEPTVLTDVPLHADVFNNEPFGPVAAIRGFDDIEDAIAEANRLPYGLGAYAFTQSIANARRISQALEAGMVWVNQPPTPFPEMPFGGVKDSGYGSEGGPEALEAYLVTKAVSIMSL